jgi:glycosyltransferase involved in cell wall biosynthesis
MKGHADLFDLLPEVLARAPDFVVLVAGKGPLASELQERAAAPPLGGSVRMLGHREEMADLLAAADFALLPSRSEGLPSALLEAYAASRPAVATAVGGVPEALDNDVEGRLVPPGDGPALRDAIVDLALYPERRRAMGERARARVVREFAATAATRRLEDAYLGWLGEREAAA